MGGVDRILRIVLGLGIAAWGMMEPSAWGFVAVVPLGTALIGVCPLYLPIGLNTGAKE